MTSYSQIVNMLPYRLKARFESLGGYVQSLIDEQESGVGRRGRLSSDDVAFIKLLVFVGTLDQFFREGSTAARSAVRRFESLGMKSFKVGSTEFKGNNEHVRRGDTLSHQLRTLVLPLRKQSAVADLALDPRKPIPTKVKEIIRHLRDGKKVD